MIKDLGMRGLFWIMHGPLCVNNHKSFSKRETRRSKSERGDMRADPEGGAMCFEGEHRAVGQGTQLLASRS